ncbi:outer membrane protein OmpK [Vibrio sp. DW001]|uniref:nucleoside-specific channel-forming Tsx family protein n=1 Tax=Vibrio sp. DW001 TaxID=2912315 RepID=UPI0023B1FB5F|nr:outer membrane protein OmpK [Vibrio sp. DW001]WED26038.1 outer membrane protein OmpK [Vibrio sp. DW001]
MRKSLITLGLLAATSAPVLAADYSQGDIHKNDYKWMQFNLMGAIDEKGPGPESTHDYLEMEFGGRSGIFDLYGYIDIFNLTSDSSSDKAGKDKMFMKFVPRASLDAMTGKDFSFGPVQELYLAAELTWDGGANGVNNHKVGLGSDIMVPWFGKMGLNLFATYAGSQKDWNGFQLSTNWFKPFYFFENGSFISYQGYIDYQFAMDDDAGNKFNTTSKTGGAMFNGIYWHSERYAVGYGLKLFSDVYGFEDGKALPWTSTVDTSGVGHYVAVTYKF